MIDGLPVTDLGSIVFEGLAITNISGGVNVVTIGENAFGNCYDLTSVSLPNATIIGQGAFNSCTALTSVSLPSATTIGISVFGNCYALPTISLPNATIIGQGAFNSCTALTSVYFGRNAPAEASEVYLDTLNVTNYVTSPVATGWSTNWNGRPVVRMNLYADNFNAAGVGASPTGHVHDVSAITNMPAIPTNTTQLVNGSGYITNVTAQQVLDAGAITNVTPAAIVAAGAVTGTPWTASVLASNLLALVANGTCSVPYRADAPATDQQFYMSQTQATVLAMGAFSTNSAWSVPLSWHTMGYQLTYCACSFRTNTGTMRTNAWNMLILSRPAFETNWTATVLP
jgi:hypothetical protein